MRSENVIAEGWQYRVIDRGDRVLKEPVSRVQTRHRVSRDVAYRFRPHAAIRKTDAVVAARRDAISWLLNHDYPDSLLGDPMVCTDGAYTQRQATPLSTALGTAVRTGEMDRARDLIDSAIDTILKCWEHGFSETTFNITFNMGVDPHGEVIVLDLGELDTRKPIVAHRIRAQRWRRSATYRWHILRVAPLRYLPRVYRLRTYFATQADRRLTLEELDRRWPETPKTI